MSRPSSRLHDLPERPPTPPRDTNKAVEDAIRFLDDSNEIERALNSSRPRSPAHSSSPTQPSPLVSQEARAGSNGPKKVGFTPIPTYHRIAGAGQQSSPTARPRKFCPSRRDARPLRSILKQTNAAPPPTPDDLEAKLSYFSPKEPGSFAKMLQSVVSQLGGPSISGRLDAYQALTGALRAYEGIPDVQSMISKMTILKQFITRDMNWKDHDGAPNFQIITNALSLTVAIFMEPKLADTLDDDFRAFVIERCILAIEQPGFSKQVIKIHMYLLAHQELYTSVMTSKRADRIIAALNSIETRCSGNSSVATRLVIYQRLLESFPSAMLNRVREWLEYVFHATLSKINEIRMRAVEVCTLASLTLGVNAAASKAILDLFENQVEDEQTYCDFYAKRLTDMIKDKEAATCVPRIWSAIILLFRNKRYPVESWTKLKPWLIIIQTCLNSSNTNTAEQAHLAWDKFVFAVMPDKSTSRNLFNLIKVPPLTSMGKGGSDKHSKQIKQSAVNSYYNLLHYGMRPGLSHEELDHAWDSYVEGGLKGMIKANGKGRLLACGVLHGLCKTGGGVWNPNAANEQTQLRPEDLPRLDSKWVRSRLGRILRLVEPIMKDLLSMPDEGAPLFDKTWQALMQTVADAGAQEVKTSNELKEALAMLANLFRSLWMSCTTIPSGSDLTTCHTHYAGYVETAVQCIGAGPFAEDILTEGSDHSLQAALTPSHRSAKHRSTLQSPLVFLFGLLHDSTSATTPIESVGPRLLRLLVSARPGRSLQLDLLCKSMQTWSMSYATGADTSVTACLWSHVADATTTLLEKSDRTDNRASDILGLEIRSACVIFAHGAKHVSHDKALQASVELYEAAFKLAKSGAKHIGATLAVVEPAAKALLESSDSVSISSLAHLASIVGASAAWPRNKQEVEQGRKALWGVSLAPSKNETFDPFDNLYQLISVTLNRTYRELETLTPDAASDAVEFNSAAVTWLGSCPASLRAAAICKVQTGFAAWLGDSERKTEDATVASALLATWRELIQLLNGLLITDTALLNALEPILVAAFSSPHKAIVNETIDFWNKSFGAQSELSYPARLEAILRTRSKEAQISLPGLSSDDALALAHLPAFYESQWQQQVLTSSDSSNIFGGDLKRMPSSAPAVRGGHFGDTDTAAHTKPLSSPVAATRRTSKVSQAKARLRHDDSQVEFAPIESSPVSFDDSQMLTERQKETRTTQLASAHMFPELSSSPIVKPRNLTRGVQKRLDFHSDRTGAELEDDAATPTGPPEIGHPMSDDMPSSPTPSSTKDADAAEIEIDPPSSPPRQEEDASEADKLTDDDVGGFEDPAAHGDGENAFKVADEPSTRLASVLPSDTLLPNEQLQMEADAAAQDQDVTDEDATEGTTCVKPIMSAEAGSAQQSNDNASVVTIETSADDDVSRVENSFVQQAPAVTPDDPSPMHVSNHSEGLGKKRKRSPRGKESSSKKQKSQSPLKKFFASFLGRSQEAQDEDIGEEIVVASSQTSHSAASAKSQQNLTPRKPIAAAPASKKLAGKPAGQDIASEQPKKRGPGRPRKSSTPATSQEQPAPGKSLKRKASTASVSSRGDLEAKSIVKGTPAPATARKQREGQDSRSTRVSQASQDNSEDKRSSRQRIAEVVIPRGEQVATNIEADAEADEVDELAGSTMNDRRDVPAVAERPIATPQSILTRLKGVLADLPRMILGSQSEREIDDMLFEIRKEVHEAGRRGKQ